jgi:hypothetical protein
MLFVYVVLHLLNYSNILRHPIFMKKLILSTLLLPFAAKTGIIPPSPSTASVEIRSGAWPMNLEKEVNPSGKSYSLIFRDQQVMDGVVMDTLPFPNVEQLKYFGKALSVLKTGNNGDIAQFKDYSIKRADKKFEKTQYILRIKFGLTDFAQAEADIMISAIKSE